MCGKRAVRGVEEELNRKKQGRVTPIAAHPSNAQYSPNNKSFPYPMLETIVCLFSG